MSEASSIDPAAVPLTRRVLAEGFRACGLAEGSIVLVHASLSRLGWIAGGPVAVVQALRDVVGPAGTIGAPTHTGENSEPSNWRNPPVPESWWPAIRESMPAFDPAVSPSRLMGVVAETIRTWPGACRSPHPVVSFAAIGPAAREWMEPHALESMLGEGSPLSRLYDLGGEVLLLGVGHERNTTLHLAEARARIARSQIREATAMIVGGERRWIEFEVDALDSDDFPELGADFERAFGVPVRRIGAGEARRMRARDLVDFAVDWLEARRAGAA